MPSSNITDSCAIYGLIHTQIFNPFAFIRESIPSGSGNTRSSHRKSVQWKSFIQKQSKWNTLSGIPRSSIPSIKLITVFHHSCRKGCGKPEAKCPGRRKCRFSGQIRIAAQNILQIRSVKEEIIQTLSRHRKFYFCDRFRCHFNDTFSVWLTNTPYPLFEI